MKDLVIALKDIHKNKKGTILHRNIQPKSVFISNNSIKLGNFRFVKKLDTEEQFATIIEYDYHIVVPMSGSYAVGLIGALFHSTDQDCTDCEDMIGNFTDHLIVSIWNTIADVHGLELP